MDLWLLMAALLWGCDREFPKAAAPERAPAPASAPVAAAPDPFHASVKPILAKKCAPCHNPGGQMYAKLPFDDRGTVASHLPGIRKRLKGDDLKAFETWASALEKPDK